MKEVGAGNLKDIDGKEGSGLKRMGGVFIS